MAKVPAVKGNTLPANWEQQMKDDAAKVKKQVASISLGQFISMKGGTLSFQGTPFPGNKLPCVILTSVLHNAYYPDGFDPSSPSSPSCYAFDEKMEGDEKAMAPHDQSPDKQSDNCPDCQWNKFGTADKGKGKACKNGVRIAVIHSDSLKADVKDSTIELLNVPATSLKGWAAFVKQLEDVGNGSLFSVTTEIGVSPLPQGGYMLTFTVLKQVDKKAIGPLFMRARDAARGLIFPYPVIELAQAPAKSKKGAKRSSGAKPQAAPRQAGPGFSPKAVSKGAGKF